MNKSELIKEVALKGQLSFNEATNAVDAIMETIAETMHKERVSPWSASAVLSFKNGKRATGIILPQAAQCRFQPNDK